MESSEDKSDAEWQSDPGMTHELPSLFVEEELETNQPLVVNTVPVLDIQPNRENLEREETVMVQEFLSDGCRCDLVIAAVHSLPSPSRATGTNVVTSHGPS